MVAAIVGRLYEAARLMPWMPPIWIREIVSEGGALRSRMLAHFPASAAATLTQVVAQDQRAGRVPVDVEPRLAFLTIAGVAMLPLAVRSMWSRLPGLADLDERALQRHAVAVLTGGLAPAPIWSPPHEDVIACTTLRAGAALACAALAACQPSGARRLSRLRRRRVRQCRRAALRDASTS